MCLLSPPSLPSPPVLCHQVPPEFAYDVHGGFGEPTSSAGDGAEADTADNALRRRRKLDCQRQRRHRQSDSQGKRRKRAGGGAATGGSANGSSATGVSKTA